MITAPHAELGYFCALKPSRPRPTSPADFHYLYTDCSSRQFQSSMLPYWALHIYCVRKSFSDSFSCSEFIWRFTLAAIMPLVGRGGGRRVTENYLLKYTHTHYCQVRSKHVKICQEKWFHPKTCGNTSINLYQNVLHSVSCLRLIMAKKK